MFFVSSPVTPEKMRLGLSYDCDRTQPLFHLHKGILAIFLCSTSTILFSQNHNPSIPSVHAFSPYGNTSFAKSENGLARPSVSPLVDKNKYAHQLAVHEADVRKVEQTGNIKRRLLKEAFTSMNKMAIAFPSYQNAKGAQQYRNAYAELLPMQYGSFSAKKATFIVENAYYEGEKDYSEFEKTIERTGDFLREKMEDLDLDNKSNLDKNYLLFQFFADTLELKSKDLRHLPFEYDFEDFWGKKDWSKMFVHKLLLTGKGQCNSLPRLYLILAEEISAKAHLALSPNHSYIKFPDDEGRWHNIELTNNMLSTDAFILNSGFVKAEAIQNKIFMHPMKQQELLSHFFSELALGYIRKYGYDDFVDEILDTALEIHPNNSTAQLSKANLLTVRLKYATEHLDITKKNFQEIKNYPQLVQLYKSVLARYKTVDNLGYAEMPAELYEKWLASVNEQETQQLNESFKAITIKQNKD